ncbi:MULTISPECIES: DUF6867 family protein [unclassified Xanthobacter]|uniref:DUF6867 family protein n=1 Tax=unclassified Xanthobacter TaxID=2623496 RepID=UPI001EDEA2A0|nr:MULTISPECIES: hypothetical protein [unclassified Xanthobacter]
MTHDPGRPSSPLLIGPLVLLVVLALAVAVAPAVLMGPSLGDFLLVSLILGGGAAWLTGKAVARGWGSLLHLLVYCILLAAAVRFAHFALFEDALFEPLTSLVEVLFLIAIATLGFRAVRKQQMSVQYGWMFAPSGFLSWRRQAGGSAPEVAG